MTCALITEFDSLLRALHQARQLLEDEAFRENFAEDYERLRGQVPVWEDHLATLQRIERRVSESFVEFDIALKSAENDWAGFLGILESRSGNNFDSPKIRYSSSSSSWRTGWAQGGLGVTLP